VRALLDETLELFEPQARERDVRLVCALGEELPPPAGDRDRLAQVLSNLIGNALQFTPPKGEVRLNARQREDRIEFTVEDTGSGISPEHLPSVFNRFWQGERETRTGAGLGLTIAKGIVEAHGGEIWVESTPGEGTTFHFTIPYAGEHREAAAVSISS
jgi:signal transduction histidine kinase